MIHADEIGPIYRRLRERMIFYAEGRGCTDPEGVADEALFRAFVHPGFRGREVGKADAYAFGVVKMVLKEWFRKAQRFAPLEGADAGVEYQSSDDIHDLRTVMQQLAPDDRELLMRYYGHGETAEELAPRFKLTPGGVRNRAFNLKWQIWELLSAA
jgi:DNA-directed RNA polymerase specialized sigma24 family protein